MFERSERLDHNRAHHELWTSLFDRLKLFTSPVLRVLASLGHLGLILIVRLISQLILQPETDMFHIILDDQHEHVN